MLARSALASEEIRRLMSVPGVNLVSAATFVATRLARLPNPWIEPAVRHTLCEARRPGSSSARPAPGQLAPEVE